MTFAVGLHSPLSHLGGQVPRKPATLFISPIPLTMFGKVWETMAGRIKPRYNATPTAREKAYHLWLIDRFDCACGCGAVSGVVHHPLTRHPEQRWRRDHEFVVPMHGFCHMRLHQIGHEREAPFTGLDQEAAYLRSLAYEAGVL